MIWLYSGTPGSGKSLHMGKEILSYLKRGKNVIGNFPVFDDIFYKSVIKGKKGFPFLRIGKSKKKSMGQFSWLKNEDFTVQRLVKYSQNYHKSNEENQTLICIDECQCMFNPREFMKADRLNWNNFMAQHRKLGFNIILVTQNDRLLDRQIRGLVEYEIKHRKINNYGIGAFLPIKTFIAIEYWYGVRQKIGSEFFTYKKVYGEKLYDSFRIFDFEALGFKT